MVETEEKRCEISSLLPGRPIVVDNALYNDDS